MNIMEKLDRTSSIKNKNGQNSEFSDEEKPFDTHIFQHNTENSISPRNSSCRIEENSHYETSCSRSYLAYASTSNECSDQSVSGIVEHSVKDMVKKRLLDDGDGIDNWVHFYKEIPRVIKLLGKGGESCRDLSAFTHAISSGCVQKKPQTPHPDLENTKMFEGSIFIDQLDASEEETFTLETFEDLIHKSHAARKSFILARVTTVNPYDKNQQYYSYYDAHQLNKILFRVEPEQNLLHRMRAKNPLNNMIILKDVQYFSITPEDVEIAFYQYKLNRYKKFIWENRESEAILDKQKPKDHDSIDESSHSSIISLYRDTLNSHAQKGEGSGLASPNSAYTDVHDDRNPCMHRDSDHGELSVGSNVSQNRQILDHNHECMMCNRHRIHDLDWLCIIPYGSNDMYNHESTSANPCIYYFKSFSEIKLDTNPRTTHTCPQQRECVENTENEIVYIARFCGFDDDFLLYQDFREYFRRNAISNDDHMLFSLYRQNEYRVDVVYEETGGSIRHSNMHGVDGPSASSARCLGVFHLLNIRSSTFRRNIFIFSVFSYLCISMAILTFLVSDSLKGITGIIFLLGLCVVIIIFIENERILTSRALEDI